jgi:hypothetical protein
MTRPGIASAIPVTVVSSGGIPVSSVGFSCLWADRPTAAAAGEGAEIFVTDAGNCGGIAFRSVSGVWRPSRRQLAYYDIVDAAGTTSASEQILKQWTGIQPGLLRSFRMLRLLLTVAKSGTTDAATQVRIRLGTAGTTSDAAVLSNTSFLAASRRIFYDHPISLTSATNILGLAGFGGAFLSTSGVADQNVTISDADANTLIMSFCVQMAGTTDTPTWGRLIAEVS